MSWVGKIIKSVFTKLLVVILLTGLCINLLVTGFFFAYRKMAFTSFDRMFIQYVNYLISDLGTPPRLDRALAIARRSSLAIHYESPERSWSTSETSMPLNLEHFRFWYESPNIRAGIHHGRHIVIVTQEDARFIFELARNFRHDTKMKWLVAGLFALLAVVFLMAYLAIRWILRPVRRLNEGVQQVGGGNLNHQIPIKGSDELRDLAEAFNTMTVRIRHMLHAKEQLLLDVSHEIRSPLTRMKVALEMMPPSSIKEIIRQDLAEMEKMVSEILETARSGKARATLTFQTIDIAECIRNVAPDFANRPPGIQFDDIPSTVEIEGDLQKIKTVLRNILDNAIKYSNKDSNPVEVCIKEQTAYIIIEIKDNGIGISAEVLPFIFEPFYRVDKSRSPNTGGYGLGLSICKTIMEAHNGKIQMSSTPDTGTTVLLVFPRVQQAPGQR
jgi:signal transduction histidine kinase